MALQCEHCQKTFPNNTSLYRHKHREHNTSTLLLVNHDHKKMDGNTNTTRKRPIRSQQDVIPITSGRKKTRALDGSVYADGTAITEKHAHRNEKRVDTDVKPSPPTLDLQNDDELQIIDEYNSNEENDDQLTITDQYDDDGQSDDNLIIVDEFNDSNQRNTANDYKKKYLECLKAHQSHRAKFLKKVAMLSSNHKVNIERTKRQLYDQCQEKIAKLKKFHERQMSDLEDLLKARHDDTIQDLTKGHDKVVNDLKNAHKKELDHYEENFQKRLKLLDDQIKAMQKNDEDLSSLSKAIFNCTTMEEIFEIQKLVNNHQLDRVIQNHLPTLQNMFLSLSYGILPICQPQRAKVTDDQREVVERIQMASPQTAKKILLQNRADIINLFTIIKNSIKLARDSYNRYGLPS